MEILIVAATAKEVEPSLLFLKEHNIDVLITGVGMVETAFALGSRLADKSYDLLLNIGVAGSFARTLPLGAVVEVVQDQLIELGAEDRDRFLSMEEIGLGKSIFSAADTPKDLPETGLEKVHAITVNTIHGNTASIEGLSPRLTGVSLESMEGAAVFYAAEKKGLHAMQVRAVSNYVEARDTSRWDIPLAVENLHEWLQRYLHWLLS